MVRFVMKQKKIILRNLSFSLTSIFQQWFVQQLAFWWMYFSFSSSFKTQLVEMRFVWFFCYNWNMSFKLEYFCWVRKLCGMFSFISSVSILVTSDNQFWGKSRIFPLQSLFRHFKHVYGLIFKHESVSQEYLQDFEMKLKSWLTRSFATKLTGHCIW